MSLRLDDTRKTPEDYFLKSWKMPLLSPLMQEPFMCEHFFRAIYLRIKEDPALTCVSGACDNYTMVCICFSWALPFSPWPWGNKDRRVIVWCLECLSQTFQRSTKNCSPLNYRRNYGEKKKEKICQIWRRLSFLVSVLSQALNASFSTLFPETKLSGRLTGSDCLAMWMKKFPFNPHLPSFLLPSRSSELWGKLGEKQQEMNLFKSRRTT